MRTLVVIALGLLVAGAAWFGFHAYEVYEALVATTGKSVPRTQIEKKIAKRQHIDLTIPPLNGNQRTNFLVLGSDNDRKREEARPLTQSMIIVSVDPLHHKVDMLSIPRDFYVPIRGHGTAKIDLAHKYGGVALARETVERLFDIPIHYYAWVGLRGFIRVINTFDGVTLDVSHPILDDTYPDDLNSANPYAYRRIFIPAGWQHMNGDQALEYVRSRHGDLIGDFGRSDRQQQVLVQLDRKINAMNVLMKLPQLAAELRNSVRTDLGLQQLYQLEQLSHQIRPQDVRRVVLQAPAFCNYDTTPDGQSILRPNWQRILPMVRRMFAPNVISRPSKTNGAMRRTSHPELRPTPAPAAGLTATPAPTGTSVPTSTPTAQEPARLPGKLIFVRGGNIYELGRDKSTKQLTFTGDAAMPSPSPDESRLAFVRFTRYASNLWLLNLRSPRHQEWQLTHDGGMKDVRNDLWTAWPTWDPNGKRLLLSWDRAKLAQPPSDIRPVDLAVWSLPLRGRRIQLTTPQRGSGGDTEVTWRPLSPQILYVRWSYTQQTNQPYSQLILYDTEHGPMALTPEGGRVLQPQWDRFGKRLTFVRRTTTGQDEIVVRPLVRSRGRFELGPAVVIAQGQVAQPSFTPDGRWISYLRPAGNGFAVYLTPVQGGEPIKVTETGEDVDARWHPVWLP